MGNNFDKKRGFLDDGLVKHKNFLTRAHLHSWHTNDQNLFSKHAYNKGAYRNFDPKNLGMDSLSYILFLYHKEEWKQDEIPINYQNKIAQFLKENI